ncbi:MAG TPA: tRNA dihydrouridine synthase DusB [Nitrospirota bacterium]|nr:tRNA dihydrouridine synthase DusB [Nitrospirota bacterium]
MKKEMKIGNVDIPGKGVLAPLAGITDLPFRLLCKEQGAALVYTEMISSEGLVRGQKGSREMMETRPEERPVAFQIFGKRPDAMAEAARVAASSGADIVDINMGCPVRKVVSSGSGAALLKDVREAERLIKAVVKACPAPVTVKIRTGWGASDFVAVELARAAEAVGAAAVAVHGRHASQGFSGAADWTAIRAVKDAVGIPVIGNGDVLSGHDAKRMLDETGCDFVMIGRGALGNPWLFREVDAYVGKDGPASAPSVKERGETLLRHLEMVVERRGEAVGVRMMRKHAAWYSKGLPGSPEFRRTINSACTASGFRQAAQEFFS